MDRKAKIAYLKQLAARDKIPASLKSLPVFLICESNGVKTYQDLQTGELQTESEHAVWKKANGIDQTITFK